MAEVCGRQRWRQSGRIKARWGRQRGADTSPVLEATKTSCLQCPLATPRPSLSSFPCSRRTLSGVYPWGCYENGDHRRRLQRVVWAGGRRPSSCPPLCLGRGPCLGLRRLLARLLRRSPSRYCRRPSPDPSASLSSPPRASSPPPLAAPCAFARAPFAALCGPKASVPPGGHKVSESGLCLAWCLVHTTNIKKEIKIT